MRILFISRYLPFTGGRETFVYNLINKLKTEHQIGLVTPDGLVGEGFSLFKYKESNLKEIISKFKPDIINSHTHYLSRQAANVSAKLGIPFVLTLHGNLFIIGSKRDQKKFRQLTKKIECLVTVSKQGKDSINANIQKAKFKTEVVHNGIDVDRFKDDLFSKEPSKTHLRSMYDLPDNKFIILTPARMAWYKGLDFLTRTIASNKKYLRKKNTYFLITTPGTRFQAEELAYLDGLTSFIEKNSIQDLVKITFASYDFMPLLYRISDGFILPSVSEQLPISILESMACGTPVIATNVGGVPEIIEDMVDGLTIQHGKDDELTQAIKYIINNKKKVSSMTKRARNKIEELFTIETASDNYLSLFRKLIHNYS